MRTFRETEDLQIQDQRDLDLADRTHYLRQQEGYLYVLIGLELVGL